MLATLVLVGAALPAAAPAHDVQIKELHATVPVATWDKGAKTWTVDLAAKIKCDPNSEKAVGRVQLAPVSAGGPAAALSTGPTPGSIYRGHYLEDPSTFVPSAAQPGLAPGVYNLYWDSAACAAEPQNEDDANTGEHLSFLEDVQIRQVELWDCATPGQARYTPRMTLRPLIPVAGDLPADAPILCPPLGVDPCAGTGARSLHPQPLLPVRPGGVEVKPCTPKGSPNTPAAEVKCPPGSHRARIAGLMRSPLLPIHGPLPGSTKGDCTVDVKVVEDKPTPPPPCKTRIFHDPLIGRPCTPKPPGPAEGYAASVAPARVLGQIRMRVPSGRRETGRFTLTAAARRALRKPDTVVRFVTSYRGSDGRLYTARSAPMTFDP